MTRFRMLQGWGLEVKDTAMGLEADSKDFKIVEKQDGWLAIDTSPTRSRSSRQFNTSQHRRLKDAIRWCNLYWTWPISPPFGFGFKANSLLPYRSDGSLSNTESYSVDMSLLRASYLGIVGLGKDGTFVRNIDNPAIGSIWFLYSIVLREELQSFTLVFDGVDTWFPCDKRVEPTRIRSSARYNSRPAADSAYFDDFNDRDKDFLKWLARKETNDA